MSEQLLLINPAGRDRRGRFLKSRKANPKKRRARRRNPVAALAANPKRRRRRNPVAALNPRRRHRHYRRNPISLGNPLAALTPALWGGAGAIAVNMGAGLIPLPAQLKTGYAKHLVNAALAIALGTFGRRLIGSRATDMANGSLVVTAYNALSEVAKGAGLNVGDLGDFGYSIPALPNYYPGQWNPALSGMEQAQQLEALGFDASAVGGETEYVEAY